MVRFHVRVPGRNPNGAGTACEAVISGFDFRTTLVVIIYALLEPGTQKIRYVGSTKNIDGRIKSHWSQRRNRQKPVSAWIRSINHKPEYLILEEVPIDYRWDAEKRWTEFIRQIPGINLLNIKAGNVGYVHPEEVRSVIRSKVIERYKNGFIPSNGHVNRKKTTIKRIQRVDSRLPVDFVPRGRFNWKPTESYHYFTQEEIEEIKNDSRSTRQIAPDYGVSHSTISGIKRGLFNGVIRASLAKWSNAADCKSAPSGTVVQTHHDARSGSVDGG